MMELATAALLTQAKIPEQVRQPLAHLTTLAARAAALDGGGTSGGSTDGDGGSSSGGSTDDSGTDDGSGSTDGGSADLVDIQLSVLYERVHPVIDTSSGFFSARLDYEGAELLPGRLLNVERFRC